MTCSSTWWGIEQIYNVGGQHRRWSPGRVWRPGEEIDTIGSQISYLRTVNYLEQLKIQFGILRGLGQQRSREPAGKYQCSAPHRSAKNNNTADQDLKELNLQQKLFRFETRNIWTLSAVGRLEELFRTMERYTWNVLDLAEVRWPRSGKMVTEERYKL